MSFVDNEFIFQGITNTNHFEALNDLLEDCNDSRFVLSSAYMTSSGLQLIENALKKVSKNTTLYIGINNGVTTYQSLNVVCSLGCRLYAVDTERNDSIFHPKLYIKLSNTESTIVIGSANLTTGGLRTNIEASCKLTVRLQDGFEQSSLGSLISLLNSLPETYPDNVFLIDSELQIEKLFHLGMLENEQNRASQILSNKCEIKQLRNKMDLKIKSIPSREKKLTEKAPKKSSKYNMQELVWESKPLTRRDLCTPEEKGTHSTGSMLLKKGNTPNIDQRHYFREAVFHQLTWNSDHRNKHLERSSANFILYLDNKYIGNYHLKITHNTDTTSRTYQQGNSTTQIHWGEAKEFVANPLLLGKIMYLYSTEQIKDYIIEIK